MFIADSLPPRSDHAAQFSFGREREDGGGGVSAGCGAGPTVSSVRSLSRRGCGQAAIEATYLGVNLVLNLIITIVLVLIIGPVGTAAATGLMCVVSSILLLFVLHRRMELPVDASRQSAGAALLAGITAGLVYWTSSRLGLPAGRQQAMISLLLLGTGGALLQLGLLASLRLVSVRRVCGGSRSLLGGAS